MQVEISTMEELNRELAIVEGQLFPVKVEDSIYRKHPGIAQSDLKTLIDFSPQHYLRKKIYKKDKDTPAKILGRLVHTVIFEPHLYEKSYVIAPEINKRTKKGKEEWTNFEEEAKIKGQTIIDQDQKDVADRIIESVANKPHVLPLVRDGLKEICAFWPHGDLTLKGKLDYYLPKSNTIVDLKTTKCAQYDIFSKDILKYKYHIQGAYYSDLVNFHRGEQPTYIIVAVETFPPYEIAIYKMDKDWLMIGRSEYTKALAWLEHCIKENDWPGYPQKTQTMRAPQFLWDKFYNKAFMPRSTSPELKVEGKIGSHRPEPPPF